MLIVTLRAPGGILCMVLKTVLCWSKPIEFIRSDSPDMC